ncbi:MAG: hypothetical protein JWR56_2221 [Massilia sp.]|nr:hypothetical protein [Massilia sp.]
MAFGVLNSQNCERKYPRAPWHTLHAFLKFEVNAAISPGAVPPVLNCHADLQG